MNEPVESPIGSDSVLKSVLLHLMPGGIQVTILALAAPVVMRLGYPSGFAFSVVNVVVGIPLMLGYLWFSARRAGGFNRVISNREPMPIWKYVVFFVLLFVFAFAVLFTISPLNEYLSESVFSWMPAYFKSSQTMLSGEAIRSVLLVMLLVQLVVDGLAVPIVEELYFRGHLMPRVNYLGWSAPLFSTFLFAVQHFWQPYNYFLIFLIVLPQAYIVWWNRNIYIGMLVHCTANSIGAILSLIALYS
ncbi:MAG: CPBP family intramembrane glutamic endopeptidase [Acidobacteriota bacterium]